VERHEDEDRRVADDAPAKWGDRKVLKNGDGAVLLERKGVDFVVANDEETVEAQDRKYFLVSRRNPASEIFKLAEAEYRRRVG
jgi:hypothetical protein